VGGELVVIQHKVSPAVSGERVLIEHRSVGVDSEPVLTQHMVSAGVWRLSVC